MNLAMEANLLIGRRSGIGNYLYNLVRQVVQKEEIERLSLFYNTYKQRNSLPEEIQNSRIDVRAAWVPQALSNRLAYALWYEHYLKHYLRKVKADIVHFPSLQGGGYSKVKAVLTVHDLSFATFYPRTPYNKFLIEVGRRSVERADLVLTDSISTKNDLVSQWRTDESKVRVVYLGCATNFKEMNHEACSNELELKFSLKPPYFLFVGNIEPRKNLLMLLSAFEKVNKIIADTSLVIIGQTGFPYPEFYEALEKSTAKERIHLLTKVSDELLPTFYNAALALVFPSLLEGFGLPILEAFRCGCPVLSSNRASLPEICGSAAILLGPNDTEAWVDSMLKISDDMELACNLRELGLGRSTLFSWERCASETVEAYKEVL